jgi:hypothetical protein
MIVRPFRTETQVAIAGILDDLLMREAGPPAVRDTVGSAFSRNLWSTLERLGWSTALDPENGGTLADVAVVAERAGYHLLSAPLAEAIVVRSVWPGARFTDGAVIASDLLSEEVGPPRLELHGDSVSGHLGIVDFANVADHLVVRAAHGVVPVVVVVDRNASGLNVRPLKTEDAVSAPAAVTFVDTPVRKLTPGPLGPAADILHAKTLLRLFDSARCVGLMDRCLEIARDHAAVRVQFGRPIGQFQAVQHRLADMTVSATTARALVDEYVADGNLDGALIANAYAGQCAVDVAESAMQVVGGIAFTAEHDLHLFLKHSLTVRGRNGYGDGLYSQIGNALIEEILQERESHE